MLEICLLICAEDIHSIAEATLVTVAALVDTTSTISITVVKPVDTTVGNAGFSQSDLFANILDQTYLVEYSYLRVLKSIVEDNRSCSFEVMDSIDYQLIEFMDTD